MLTRSATLSNPATEPLTLEEAKKHLEIADSDDAHDTHVGALVVYAREKFETDTGRITIQRTATEKMRDFPGDGIVLHYRPAASITHIKAYVSDVLTTVSSGDYSLDTDRRTVFLDDDATWPTPDDRWDAVQITYTVGEATASSQVSEWHKQAMKLLIENAFDDRHKDSTSLMTAYENLIRPLMRATYP